MRNFTSINENRDFLFLYRKGKSFCADSVVLYVRKNRTDKLRLGITVTKKVGKAVVRNRVKRRIKESFLKLSERIPSGFDIIIVARIKAASCRYAEINSALTYLMSKAGLI